MKIIYTEIVLSDDDSEKLNAWEMENNSTLEDLLIALLNSFILELPTEE